MEIESVDKAIQSKSVAGNVETETDSKVKD